MKFIKGLFKMFLALIVVLIVIGVAVGSTKEKPASSEKVSTVSKKEPVKKEPVKKEPEVPAEFKTALTQAQSYSDNMFMSKQAIYDQLTSQYGGKFEAEPAQYAVDTLKADYNYNAVQQAKSYRDTMSMSTQAVRDQLVSPNGGQFTEAEADYGIANIDK